MNKILQYIENELRRQRRLGYTTEHDSLHNEEELLQAARCYLLNSPEGYPWDNLTQDKFSSENKNRNLVIAATLIIAELERIGYDEC